MSTTSIPPPPSSSTDSSNTGLSRPTSSSNTTVTPELITEYFAAIAKGDSDTVRELIAKHRELTRVRQRGTEYRYDPSFELDAYKFLGAYLGQLSGLHLALLLRQDTIARDIMDVTFDQDLHLTFGDSNTTLHLAAFMESTDVVTSLLARGGDATARNGKGFTPIDVSGDADISQLLSTPRQ